MYTKHIIIHVLSFDFSRARMCVYVYKVLVQTVAVIYIYMYCRRAQHRYFRFPRRLPIYVHACHQIQIRASLSTAWYHYCIIYLGAVFRTCNIIIIYYGVRHKKKPPPSLQVIKTFWNEYYTVVHVYTDKDWTRRVQRNNDGTGSLYYRGYLKFQFISWNDAIYTRDAPVCVCVCSRTLVIILHNTIIGARYYMYDVLL